VAALSLHHFDINFCGRILKEHRSKFVEEYSDLSLALWIAVLTKFMSCFQGAEARPQLDPKKVFGADPKALQQFELLMALRNKPLLKNEWVEMGDPAPPRRRRHGGAGAGALGLVKPLPPEAVAGRPGFTRATRPPATIATGAPMGCDSRPRARGQSSRRALNHPFEIR
jgi:hypothetical protein